MPDESAKQSTEQQQQEDLNNRINAFMSAYEALVKEHKIDFAQYPMWVPDGAGAFKCIIQSTPVDMSNQPVKSPIIVQS